MITKAIVEEVVDLYHIRVRIPTINKAEGTPACTPFEQLYIATICCPVGSRPNFVKGDIVFVSFEDNSFDKPIIVGTLFRESLVGLSGQTLSNLVVNLTCNLPEETTIGSVNEEDISNLSGTKSNLQRQIDVLIERLDALESDIEADIRRVENTLNSAMSTANSAQSLANSVMSTANSAMGAANSAMSTANLAMSTANSAQSLANSAQSLANALQSRVSALESKIS